MIRLRDVFVRAWQRGYSPRDILPCIKADKGGGISDVDAGHPAYPRNTIGKPLVASLSEYLVQAEVETGLNLQQPKRHGPGTELKKLLTKVGIRASPNCSCNAKARIMDERGCDWCDENIDTIVGWLRDEATKRKLPFVDLAGRLIVKRAIRNARRLTPPPT